MTGGEGAGLVVPGPREVNKMKAVTKVIFLDEAGEKFFGEGPCRLLHGVEETGSLRAAALSMGMAYTKALNGGRDGGGSSLTPEGKEWLQRYEAYRDACAEAGRRLYLDFFPEQR